MVNDFSLLQIKKIRVVDDQVEVLKAFDIPNKDEGGSNGLTTDGEYLYLRTRREYVAKLDKEGNLVGRMHMDGGPLVWNGEHFWTVGGCDKGICKYDENGKLVGEIYPPAKDPWAITWDGKYLWTRQRTCEMWSDPKLYQIEILDDSIN